MMDDLNSDVFIVDDSADRGSPEAAFCLVKDLGYHVSALLTYIEPIAHGASRHHVSERTVTICDDCLRREDEGGQRDEDCPRCDVTAQTKDAFDLAVDEFRDLELVLLHAKKAVEHCKGDLRRANRQLATEKRTSPGILLAGSPDQFDSAHELVIFIGQSLAWAIRAFDHDSRHATTIERELDVAALSDNWTGCCEDINQKAWAFDRSSLAALINSAWDEYDEAKRQRTTSAEIIRATAPPISPPKIIVSIDPPQITIDGTPLALTQDESGCLQCLVNARDWLSSRQVSERTGVARADRIIKSLREVKLAQFSIIETSKNVGSRIKPSWLA